MPSTDPVAEAAGRLLTEARTYDPAIAVYLPGDVLLVAGAVKRMAEVLALVIESVRWPYNLDGNQARYQMIPESVVERARAALRGENGG